MWERLQDVGALLRAAATLLGAELGLSHPKVAVFVPRSELVCSGKVGQRGRRTLEPFTVRQSLLSAERRGKKW